jgi:hypothetical protein
MTTEFNARPLNDRLSDIPEDDEPGVDDKAVINDDEPTFHEAHESSVPQREHRTQLFEDLETERLRGQWMEVQARFVDEPKTSVQDAESLLSSVLDELKSHIEGQKGSLDTNDTEDLRVAMQRYRSLFDQILSV